MHKITISTHRVVREVSKHRFSGSRNLFVSLNFMCDKWKTLLSTLWASGIMRNPIKWTKIVIIPPRAVKVMSKHMFLGSRNHLLASNASKCTCVRSGRLCRVHYDHCPLYAKTSTSFTSINSSDKCVGHWALNLNTRLHQLTWWNCRNKINKITI